MEPQVWCDANRINVLVLAVGCKYFTIVFSSDTAVHAVVSDNKLPFLITFSCSVLLLLLSLRLKSVIRWLAKLLITF